MKCPEFPNCNNYIIKNHPLVFRRNKIYNFDIMSSNKYVKEKPSLDDYKCDQTIIINRNYLKYVYGLNYNDPENIPLQCKKRYPFTNSYYRHTEYVDALKRVTHTLDCKYFLEASSTDLLIEKDLPAPDPYSERGAQVQYLSKNPISFLILGKPGIGEQEVGRLLAEHWNCVYIDPETLVAEEILSGSRAGRCIDYNLRSGRAINVDIILKLIEKRVRSKTASHRGFVICGFPLIPNDLYEEDPVSSESALFNVRDIFEEIIDEATKVDEVLPEIVKAVKFKSGDDESDADDEDDVGDIDHLSESTVVMPSKQEPPPDYGSLLGSICAPPNLEKNYEQQLDFIFNLFTSPFQIIYICCDHADVISRRNANRFDIYNGLIVNKQDEEMEQLFFDNVYFPVNQEDVPEDISSAAKLRLFNYQSALTQHLLRLPNDFPANVSVQLGRYYTSAMPIMECYILAHDPEYYLRVDGRLTPSAMFSAIRTRISIMPFQKVVVPEKILQPEVYFGGENEPIPDDDDFTGMTPEDVYDDFRKRRIVAPLYKWTWSDWNTKCPVAMKESEIKDGVPEFAVHLFNNLFFLSSEEAVTKFIRNPRPFLLPPYPKPSCRIFVMGPRSSGKSAVSTCLAYLLDGTVISPEVLEAEFKERKQQEYMDRVRAAALTEGIKILDEQREREYEEAEIQRFEEIKEFRTFVEPLLGGLIEYYDILPKEEDTYISEDALKDVSSFAIKIAQSADNRRQREMDRIKGVISEYEKELDELNLPFTYEECSRLLENPEEINNYLPESLTQPTKRPPPSTVLDQFVIDYANDVVAHTKVIQLDISEHEAFHIYADAIKAIEDRNESLGNNRGGWIIDGLSLNLNLIELFNPDYMADNVYILKDEPDNTFLMQRFETRGANHFRHFRELFLSIGKPDAAFRSPSTKSTDSYKAKMATYILDEILDRVDTIGEMAAEDDERFKEDYFKKHPRRAEASEYAKHVSEFEEKLKVVLEFFETLKVPVSILKVTDKPLEFLLVETIKNVEDLFRVYAKEMTQADREEELRDILGEPIEDEALEEEEEEEELGAKRDEVSEEDIFFANRRYGDTFWFCPYVFKNYFVLWRGRDEFCVKFMNKVYLLSSDAAMSKFIDDPRKYLPLRYPPRKYPPPRICIVGPHCSGRTTLARTLAKNFGLFNISLDRIVQRVPPLTYEEEEVLEEEENKEDDEIKQMAHVRNKVFEKIKNCWFAEPYKSFGFVMDAYPIEMDDAMNMLQNFLIPDVVLEMKINDEELHRRIIDTRIDQWRKERFESVQKQNEEIIRNWEINREMRIKELMKERREIRYENKLKELEEQQEAADATADAVGGSVIDDDNDAGQSQMSYNSVEEQEDLDIVLRIVAEEISNPVLVPEPQETLEEIVQIVTRDIMDAYTNEVQQLQTVKEMFESQIIPWVEIDANLSPDKVFAQAVRAAENIKLRNQSFFERVYDIDFELAEKVLSEGYFFTSKFGKTCPVQIYEAENTIQMYLPLEEKNQIFPLTHRNYIYFLAGKRNRDLFIKNPLKYVQNKDVRFPLIPFKVGVIGPPKSGKTSLAKRFRKDIGLLNITRGNAIRYVLKYLPNTKLAKETDKILRKGWYLPDEIVMKCVSSLTLSGRSSTQGFVLDGFPERIEEVHEMVKYQLLPYVSFDMMSDEDKMFEFMQDAPPPPGIMPCNYSKTFMRHRYNVWNDGQKHFRNWLKKEYQIIAKLEVNKTKWGIWADALQIALSVLYEVKSYYKNAGSDVVLHIANMMVSHLEYLERKRNRYWSYCPCCLYYDDALVTGGEPPDRTGLVQYKEHFYWLCQDHMQEFRGNPNKFLPPYNSKMIPQDLPEWLHLTDKPDDCHANGICIVCYWLNLPKRILIDGSLDFCVKYKDIFYLFDSVTCLQIFMRRPQDYFNKTVVPTNQAMVSLDAKNLPIIGYLEQCVAPQILSALKVVSRLRPVVPGLSISMSAAILIGLYLKVHNQLIPDNYRERYEEGMKSYHKRRTDLIKYLEAMKKRHNPHLYYEEPIPKFVDPILDKPLHPAITAKKRLPEEETVEYDSVKSSFTESAIHILDDILNKIDYSGSNG